MFLSFPAFTLLQTSEFIFTVICGILWPFAKCDVRCGELSSSFGKVHSASPVFYFVQWHAGTRSHVGNSCVMDLFYRFHVICGQEFKAFFYVWDGLCSLFFPPPAWDCVCWGVSVIFIFSLSLSLPVKFSSPTLSLSVFLFFQLVIKYIFSH